MFLARRATFKRSVEQVRDAVVTQTDKTPELTGDSVAPKKAGFRFSLKWEWALSTAFGVLVIFAAIVFLIFNSFMTVLMRQEKTHVSDTLNVVVEKLNSQKQLTSTNVNQLLRPQAVVSATKQPTPYNNAVIASLARDSQAVTVYDADGQSLFATRQGDVSFRRASKQSISTQTVSGRKNLVGRSPIRAKQGNRILGYVQVTDNLRDYRATQVKLLQVEVVLGLMAGLAAAVLSYSLATFLLRPVEEIRETIHAVREDPQTDKRVPRCIIKMS